MKVGRYAIIFALLSALITVVGSWLSGYDLTHRGPEVFITYISSIFAAGVGGWVGLAIDNRQ